MLGSFGARRSCLPSPVPHAAPQTGRMGASGANSTPQARRGADGHHSPGTSPPAPEAGHHVVEEEDGVLHVWLRVVVLPPQGEGHDRGHGGGAKSQLPGRLLARGHALLFGHHTSVPSPRVGRGFGGPQLRNAASLVLRGKGGEGDHFLRGANVTLW
jgi:hypothetical protein